MLTSVGEAFAGSLVRMAACGYEHTLVVTVAGVMWTWGSGDCGRLGLNDKQPRLVPTLVDSERLPAGGGTTRGSAVRLWCVQGLAVELHLRFASAQGVAAAALH